ncbi:hypothetical protein F3Y22_tig00008145pilonHSYRG00108 [Hibiscus syriacus]|uniref:Uncharacterized protein n=1 Tax=Hibiscus syriacus TaxID=106335 RepID=A0A6A3CDK4_HIBSY|nr:hypothetical protein F3Y22_tig00008145pilonHSYRG00108 [Hibiscus syriacus]
MAMSELPVIDFSNQHLKPGSPEWDSAVFNGLKNVFELPLETKMKNMSDNPSHAYIAPYANAPLYESIGIEDPNVAQNVESLTNSFWPMETQLSGWMLEKMSEVDRMLLECLADRLDLVTSVTRRQVLLRARGAPSRALIPSRTVLVDQIGPTRSESGLFDQSKLTETGQIESTH